MCLLTILTVDHLDGLTGVWLGARHRDHTPVQSNLTLYSLNTAYDLQLEKILPSSRVNHQYQG